MVAMGEQQADANGVESHAATQDGGAADAPPAAGVSERARRINPLHELPASPIAPPDASQAVALNVLELEQWLDAAGWRRLVNKLGSQDAATWAAGVDTLRAWLELCEQRIEARVQRAFAFGILAGAAVGAGVMWIAVRLLLA